MRNVRLVLFLLPLIMIFFCVYYFGVNIPYVDDWPFLNHLLLFKEGKETISDICLSSLWEHMVGTGFVLTLFFAMVAGYNFKAMLIFNIFILILGFLIILRYSFKEFNISFKNIPLWFIPIPFLWFSWVQADNILTVIHSCLLVSVLLSLLAFYFCYCFIKAEKANSAPIFLVSMVVSATLASFAMINGLFVWPIIIFNILFFSKNKTCKFVILVFSISVYLVYFSIRPIFAHTSDSFMIKLLTEYSMSPVYSISYLISLFGLFANYNYYVMSAFICLIAGTMIITAVAFLMFQICYRDGLYRENIFLCSIVIYSLIIHLSVFYKNCQFYIGMPFFLSSRYSSFNIILVIAVYLLYVKIYSKSNPASGKINYVAIALIFICILHYVITPFTYIQPFTDKKIKSIFALLDCDNKEDQSFYAITINDRQHVNAIREIVPLMEKHSISMFNKMWLEKNYPIEYALKYKTGGEISRIDVKDFEITGKWSFIMKGLIDCMHTVGNLKLNPDFLVFSKSRCPGKNQIRSKTVMVSTDSFLYCQFMLSGNFKNRKIGLDLNNDGVSEVDCEPRQKPRLFKLFSRLFYVAPESPYCFDVLFDLSDYKGMEVSFIISDAGESDSEWIAFAQPIILKKINGTQDK